MRTLLTLLMLARMASPQTAVEVFRKAPPATDTALRERVSKFYQTYVDKKWRQSDQFVAEESKDRYYAAPKPSYFSYQITEIQYTENFTRATVLGLAEQDRMVAMGGVMRMKVPMQSYWKVMDGTWMWYLPERNCVATPMGCGALTKEQVDISEKQKQEIQERINNPPVAQVLSAFGFGEATERPVLTAASPRLERTFHNKLNGYLVPKILSVRDPDVEAEFVPAQIPPMSSGKLVVKMKPGAKFTPRTAMVEIEVFTKIIPFGVTIEGPANPKK